MSQADEIAAIEQLKYRYLRCVDLRLWDELAETLTAAATATYGKRLQMSSRDAIIAELAKTMTPDIITEHRVNHPEITVSGDTATGRWYLQDRVIIPAHNTMIFGAAFYTDAYERHYGRWLIARTGYERTYEAIIDLNDIPSFRLTENFLAH